MDETQRKAALHQLEDMADRILEQQPTETYVGCPRCTAGKVRSSGRYVDCPVCQGGGSIPKSVYLAMTRAAA